MRLAFLILTLAALLGGCPRYDPSAAAVPPTPAPAPTPTPQPDPTMLVFSKTASNDGTYIVRYAPKAGVPLNEPFGIVVSVWENSEPERPARGVSIDVDGRMPHHHHGMTQVPVVFREAEPGRFAIDGLLFHMPGYWEIHVDITRDDVTERAQFPVQLD